MQEYRLQAGHTVYRIMADLLGHATTKISAMARRERSYNRYKDWRWQELTLYRDVDGQYILHKVGASAVLHVSDCRDVIEDLPRFQEAHPGADPDDAEFIYHECVGEWYDFPSLLIEAERRWVQITSSPEDVIKQVMRYRGATRWMPRVSDELLRQASMLDPRLREAYAEAASAVTR